MGRIEKTVFISYRRTNLPWALAIYQELTHNGYDVFFDYLSIPSGDFENIIVENIKARAHFVVILTPSALERCNEPGDWLRREIETAIDEKRNIVPLMLESFDFGSPSTVNALSGKLEKLKKYNGLRLHSEYFFEGMSRLRDQFLSVSLDAIIHPIAQSAKPIIEEHQVAASGASSVEKEELTAQEWFEKGYVFYKDENFEEAIRCLSEAINLNADSAEAHSLRGQAHARKGDFDDALQDCKEAIRIDPNNSDLYFFRGYVRRYQGDLIGTIEDFTEGIRLQPDDADGWYERGLARKNNDDLRGALEDYDEAIRLKPNFADAYLDRGTVRKDNNDLKGALADYNVAVRLDPDVPDSYFFRALLWVDKKNYSSAIADFQKYLELGGGTQDGDQKEVKATIKKLKSKLSRKKTSRKKANKKE